MVQQLEEISTIPLEGPLEGEALAERREQLKTEIKKLNSKAGQMKMDLHDLADDTYAIFKQMDDLKKQLASLS
jgi:hypothetical protein